LSGGGGATAGAGAGGGNGGSGAGGASGAALVAPMQQGPPAGRGTQPRPDQLDEIAEEMRAQLASLGVR
jgi:hypothetical protein